MTTMILTTIDRMKTQVVAGGKMGPLVRNVVCDTAHSFDRLICGRQQFIFQNRSTIAEPIDIVRWLSEHANVNSGVLHIRNMILNAVHDAEKKSPGSGVITIAVVATLLNKQSSLADLRSLSATIASSAIAVVGTSRRCQVKEAQAVMKQYDISSQSLKITMDALELCSSNASLSIESGPSRETKILSVHGHNFPGLIPDIFISASRMIGKKALSDPRVMVIDGLIERMSEIEGVVGGSYRAKSPLVIIARGFSSDVQNTLGTNYSTGHLKIIPFCVPYDELGANLLNDMAIVCGADIVSSLKGELISTREWNSLRYVRSITMTQNSITIANDENLLGIKRQRAFLREKRKNCDKSEVPVLEKRLHCLMGKGVNISLGKDLGHLEGIYKDRIGSLLLMFKTISRRGIIDLQVVKGRPGMNGVYDRLISRFRFVPAESFITGIRSGISCANNLAQVGGVIYND